MPDALHESGTRLRVLMITNLWPPVLIGGAERYASNLTEGLRARGHEVAAVTAGVPGPDVVGVGRPFPYRQDTWFSQPEWKRIMFQAADIYRPDAARVVRRAIRQFKPDVVHSHTVMGLSVAALTVPSRVGVAHVHTLHDYWLLCRRSTLAGRDGLMCQTRCGPCRMVGGIRARSAARGFAHLAIAPSQAVIDVHHRHGFPLPRTTVTVRHPAEQPSLGHRVVGVGARTFGFIGQLNPNKGIRTLVEAMAHPGLDEARLVIAGDGSMSGEIRQQAALSGGRITYLGHVDGDDKRAFFDEVDCLVVPSIWEEPAGLVNLEAHSAGRAVIGAAIGGIGEYVPASCRPLLFEAGSADGLAESMRRFMHDPVRYVPVDRPTGWPEHLDAIEAAYLQARTLTQSTH